MQGKPWEYALKEFAAEARRDLVDHPESEELTLFARGNLESEHLERMRDHLALCQECLDKVLDQKVFPFLQPPMEEVAMSETQVESGWQAVRRKLLSERLMARESRRRQRTRFALPARATFATLAAVAALVLVAGLGLLRPRFGILPTRLARPAVNTQIVSLLPEKARAQRLTRGLGMARQTVSVPRFADSVLIILNVSSLADFAGYEANLFAEGVQAPLWRDSTVRRTRDQNFNVLFPRSAFSEGDYVISLWGRSGSQSQLIAQFRFHVRYETGVSE